MHLTFSNSTKKDTLWTILLTSMIQWSICRSHHGTMLKDVQLSWSYGPPRVSCIYPINSLFLWVFVVLGNHIKYKRISKIDIFWHKLWICNIDNTDELHSLLLKYTNDIYYVLFEIIIRVFVSVGILIFNIYF